MVYYVVSTLVKEVKVVLDRNQESAALVPDDSDTLSQGELIQSRIVDAAKLILTDAPSELVEGVVLTDGKVLWQSAHSAYVGKVQLPSDLIRILSVRVSDWIRPGKLISEDDDEYKLQSCRFGLRGNVERPVAAIVHTGGGRYLELYTSNTNDATLDLSCVKLPDISNGMIGLPQGLKDAIVYMTAYLVCVSLGDSSTAEGLLSVARNLAGIANVEPSQMQ
jgi:hypothetical protein